MMKLWRGIIAILMIAALICPAAVAEDAQNITDQCKFWVSEGSPDYISDISIKTGWAPANVGAEVRVALPENAGYLALDWFDDPTGYIFTQYNAAQEPIAATDEKESYVGITQLFRLQEDTRYVSLQLTQPGQAVHKIRVYTRGELTPDIKDFLPPLDKCDLMVVSAHQDDEWIFFGGIIPYYQCVQDKDVQVVYMANCGRFRKAEALNGLWTGGVLNHPEFIDLKDENISSIETALEHWGGREGLMGQLVERIRRFQPEVILTHDYNGEYGHKQHILTATAMSYAIAAAADPTTYPESYEKYGAWEVKKLYIHLATECEIDFDWNKPYEELNGQTPLEVARRAYDEHESQHKYYQVEDGGKYDNSRFGLTYSTVGWDEVHDDLFENIAELPESTPVPTSEPTPEPTAEPAAAPEAVQTPQPEIQPEIKDEKTVGAGKVILIITGCIAVAAVGGLILHRQMRIRRLRMRKRNMRRR